MANTPRPTPISLEIPAGLEIIYANLARISHSPADIVMDFAHALPGENKAVIKGHVISCNIRWRVYSYNVGSRFSIPNVHLHSAVSTIRRSAKIRVVDSSTVL